MIKKCKGCGQVLQDQNLETSGYVKDMNFDYCLRCFKINNYSETQTAKLNFTNEEIVKKLNQKAKYVIFITDFLTLSEEVIATFKKIKTNKCLVINKFDLLPKDLKANKIKEYLKENYQIEENIYFLSVLKAKNFEIIKNLIIANNQTYIVGYTNSGKSSLINLLTQEYGLMQKKITVSSLNNTTLDFISLKLAESTFYDTPGFNLVNFIQSKEILKKINTKKYIKPRTYQLKENMLLELENIFLVGASNNSLTFYVSNELEIKKKYEKIDNLIEVNIKDNTDLVIKGVGFINIKKGGLIKVSSLEMIEIRESIFK